MGDRILAAALALAIALPLVATPAAAADPSRRVIGPPQEVAALLDGRAAPALPTPTYAPAPPAPLKPGPVWWRVSNGRSALWILGVPDVTLEGFDWDHASLNRRVDAAGQLFYPRLSGGVLNSN